MNHFLTEPGFFHWLLIGWWRKDDRPDCPKCGNGKGTITTRNMGGIVPYEWITCDNCGFENWGARL